MHPLSYDIRPSKDREYIVVELDGLVDHENTIPVMRDAFEIVLETGINRVLLDSRKARNADSVADNVRFVRPGREIDNPVLKSVVRVLLVHEDDRSHDFVVQALRLKGHNIVVSRDEVHAIGILTDDLRRRWSDRSQPEHGVPDQR